MADMVKKAYSREVHSLRSWTGWTDRLLTSRGASKNLNGPEQRTYTRKRRCYNSAKRFLPWKYRYEQLLCWQGN